jgi:hypothetical protein
MLNMHMLGLLLMLRLMIMNMLILDFLFRLFHFLGWQMASDFNNLLMLCFLMADWGYLSFRVMFDVYIDNCVISNNLCFGLKALVLVKLERCNFCLGLLNIVVLMISCNLRVMIMRLLCRLVKLLMDLSLNHCLFLMSLNLILLNLRLNLYDFRLNNGLRPFFNCFGYFYFIIIPILSGNLLLLGFSRNFS